MAKQVVRGRLLKWGHTKGVRIPKADAARVNIPLGSDVRLTIEVDTPPKNDLTSLIGKASGRALDTRRVRGLIEEELGR